MKKKYALLPVVLLLWPSPLWGGWMDYRPRLLSSHADLSAEYDYKTDLRQQTIQDGEGSVERGNDEKQKKIRESLSLQTLSYLYHPELFYFSLNGKGFLDQVDQEINDQAITHQVTTESYDFRGFLLKRKAFHGEIYSNTNKPFLSARGELGEVENSLSGLDLYYDKIPYRAYTSVSHSLNQSSEYFRSTDQAKASFTYDKDDLAFDSHAEHEVGTFGATQQTVDSLNLGNRSLYKTVHFNTGLTVDRMASEDIQSQGYAFREAMASKLPWNSNWRGQYSRQQSSTDSSSVLAGVRSDFQLEDLDLLVENKLYDSLRSALRGSQRTNRSSQGQAKDQNLTIESHYLKKIRGGSLTGDLANKIFQVENQGRITESKSFAGRGISDPKAIGGSLDQPLVIPRGDIDPLLVNVEVETDPGHFEFLQVDLYWYRDTTVPNLTIFITDKIAELFRRRNLPVPSAYNFRVTYTTLPANYTLQTNDTLFHASVGFFENVWRTDYSHEYTIQDVVAGDPLIRDLAPAITSDTLSLTYSLEPFTVSTGYRIVQADYSGQLWHSSAEFAKQFQVLGPWSSKVRLRGKEAESWLDPASGESSHNQESSFGGQVASSLLVPGTGINIGHDLKYEIYRGYVNEFQGYFNYSYLVIPIRDRDLFSSDLTLRTNIPKTRVQLTARSYYSKEIYLEGMATVRSGYKVAANYGWDFGLTRMSLNADYSNERVDTDNGQTVDMTVETITDIYLKMTRQLF